MLRTAACFAGLGLVAAQPPKSTWFGMAPDTTVPGQINIFTMNTQGEPLNAAAAVATSDQEYPKSGTLHCAWGSNMCYFLTGVGRPYVQDAIYGVDRVTGKTIFKHEVPAGIYLDNLVLDWATDKLYSVAFNPNANPPAALIVTYDGQTGNVTIGADISRDLRGGFIFEGSVTICPSTKQLFVGLDMRIADGTFGDRVLAYDISGAAPTLAGELPLLFPIPSAIHAFCNATHITAMVGDYIQSASEDREKLVLGDIQREGREGLFFPLARGDLPTFNARGQMSLFLNGLIAEHAGTFIVPIFPPFTRGPGPAPALPGGFVWTWDFTPFPTPGRLSPIGYYLAGASGVPAA